MRKAVPLHEVSRMQVREGFVSCEVLYYLILTQRTTGSEGFWAGSDVFGLFLKLFWRRDYMYTEQGRRLVGRPSRMWRHESCWERQASSLRGNPGGGTLLEPREEFFQEEEVDIFAQRRSQGARAQMCPSILRSHGSEVPITFVHLC